MRRLLFTLSLLGILLAPPAHLSAQNPQTPPAPGVIKVTLADGREQAATTVRRSKDTLLVTVAVATGVRGEVGYPISTVRRIEFPEPPQLQRARQFLAGGRPADALKVIHPIVLMHGDVRQIPGNHWAPAAMIEVDALVALGRDRDAESLINQLTADTKDPDVLPSARMAQAALWTRTGRGDQAAAVFDEVIATGKSPRTLARAWSSKGDALLAQKDYDGALLAYLRIPVFYFHEAAYVPAALLGSARAYAGLGEFEPARAALEALSRDHASSPEAAQAKPELARVERKLNADADVK